MSAQCKRRAGLLAIAGFLLQVLGTIAPARAAAPATAPTTHPSTAPAFAGQNLFADGSPEMFWMAQVLANPEQPSEGDVTRVMVRKAGAAPWTTLPDLPRRGIALAHLGSRAAVLLQGGNLMLVNDEGDTVTGQPLPGGEPPLVIASDADTLWAVGIDKPFPDTRPATTQADTRPSMTAMPPPRLALFILNGATWQVSPGPALPADISLNATLSVAIIDRTPWLAVRESSGQIHVLRRDVSRWTSVAYVAGPPADGAFKLLSGLSPAALWVAGIDHDRLDLFQGDEKTKTIALRAQTAPISSRAAAFAINAVREMALVDGKPVEQDYDYQTFAPSGSSAAVAAPAAQPSSGATNMLHLSLVMLLVFAILSSMRRRNTADASAGESENFELADLRRRLAAGLIDAIPFIAPILIAGRWVNSGDMQHPSSISPGLEREAFYTFLAATAVYLIHTAATEAIAGRSIGKMLMGLRVVRLDGGTPDASSLLIRNFLRVIDIALFGTTLVLIVFSPLRQRIGDVAGGTMVVRDRVRPEGTLIEPPKADTAATAGGTEPPMNKSE